MTDGAEGNFQLGLFHTAGGDYNKAFEYYKLSADAGHPEAQYRVALCYRDGLGAMQNLQQTIKYYKLSAKAGHSNAQFNLGVCYENGTGVLVNFKKATKYYKQSAKQGNSCAQNNLGVCYKYGSGVPQDDEMAIKYYKLSMAQGNKSACFNLGLHYKDIGEYKKAIELFTSCDKLEHVTRCEIKLIEKFNVRLHTNDIIYMYPLCVKHKHRDVDLLKLKVKCIYTEYIPLILDLAQITISYLI